MASGETELQFRVEVGGINQFGKLNSQVVMLNKGLIRVKQSNQNLVSVFKKQKGVAGTVNKIFYGQAQTLKQLVRNQKIFRREITHITGKMKVARKETRLGSKEWRHYSRMIRRTRKDMRSLPLRKLGTDLRNLTTRMVKMGKNLQWVGRQMMVGITAPLGMLLRIGMRAFESFEKQLVRTQKILALTNKEMEPIRENIMGISTRMGVARSIVAGLTSDFAQMGRNLLGGNEALTETAARYAELTLQLELVGQVSANVGRDFIANLAGIVKHSTNVSNRMEIVAGLLAKFNMLENTTALSLKDLAEAFPQVSPAAKAAGVDLLFLAGVIGNMKEVGLNATESAHALKFGLQRLINPTRKVRDMAEEFADAIGPEFHEDLGFGNMLLFNLAENMQLIEQRAGSKAAISYLGELVGKRQASRLFAATMNMRGFAESVDQIHEAFARATQIDPSTMFEGYEPTGVQMAPQIQELAGVSNIDELRTQIQSIFQDDAHLQAFKDSVIATDMAIAAGVDTLKTHSEGLNETSATSRVLTVAFQELEPALKGLAIDFMGATVAGKVFEEEMNVVLMGPAATLARLKNDMKNMLQEFAASFYTALKPAIAAIRQFILKIRDMPAHMKQGIVVMLGMLAVVGPLAFGIAMMMVSFGVIGAVLVRIIPQMKSFSQSLMVSKHLAGEAADRLVPFGAGLAVVGKAAGNTAKNVLGLTSAVHAQAAALQADMSVALSSFGAFSALVTTEVATATGKMLTTLGTAHKSLTALSIKGLAGIGVAAGTAATATFVAAAQATAAAAVEMGGAEMMLGQALQAEISQFTAATTKLSGLTAKTSRRARNIIIKDAEVIKVKMLDTMAQLGAAGATTVATTAGVAHSATAATTAAQAKMFSTTRGMFAANNAMLKAFTAKASSRIAKIIGMQKISAALAARKLPARVPAGMPGAGQFTARLTGTARLTAFTSKTWAVVQKKIGFGWLKVSKDRITSGVAAVKAVKMAEVKAAFTTKAGWKKSALGSAKAFLWAFKGAFKAIRLNAAMSATFMQFVFSKASKAIRLAMMGTGIMMILIAVAGAIVFIVAHFDKFKKAAGGALGAFKQAWTNLKGTFMEVGAAIFEIFGQIFGGEAQEGADGMAQTFDGVTVAIQFIADALVLLSRIFLTYVRGVIIPLIRVFGAIFGWLVGKIREKVQQIEDRWAKIGPFIGRIVSAILLVFGLMVKNIAIQVRILSTILGRLAEGVFWLLEEVFAPVIGGIVSLFSMLLGVVTEVVRHILLKFLDFLKWIEPVMSKLLGGFNDIIDFLNWALGSDMGSIEFNFGTDIDDLKDKINDGFAAVDDGREDVEKFINDAVPAIVGVAGDVVGGIITGINEAATKVDNNIMGLVAGWSDNLNGALAGEEGASLLAENLEDATEDIGNRPWVTPEDAGPMSVSESIELAAYEGLQNALNTFVDRVKTALTTAVADQVKAGMAAFAAKADIYLQGFETQIEAIENVKKAEKELTATIKYETDRRAQINKMALDKENFIRNRTLAIYEGRIEDARNLSVEFSTNQEKSNDRLTKLDDKRAEKVLNQQRDEAIAQINQAQEDAKNRLDLLKIALESELNVLAAILPKDEAEWAEMLTGMDSAVSTAMTDAFGPEGSAATSLDTFAGIVDEKLGDKFGSLLADINVDTTGITSVAGTLQTSVDEWTTIIEGKDFGTMFTNIFDKVNEVWKEELRWEKAAHEWMTNHFDDEISDLIAHIKWLKGELDNLTGDFTTDTTPDREAARREAHRIAREGGEGHDATLSSMFGGWGSSNFFNLSQTPAALSPSTMNAQWANQMQQQYTAQSTAATAAAAAQQATNIGNAVGIVLTPALTDIVAAVTAANSINLTIDTTDIAGRGLDDDLGSPKGVGGGTAGGGTPWDTNAWYYTPNFSDDTATEKIINTTLNAAGWVATKAVEEVVTTITDPLWAIGGFIGDIVGGSDTPGPAAEEAIAAELSQIDFRALEQLAWSNAGIGHTGGLIEGAKGKVKRMKLLAGEYIMNSQAVSRLGIGQLDAANQGYSGLTADVYGTANTMLAAGGAGGGTGGGDVTIINIDTMVGDPAFAESQAKIFKEHVQPKQDRNAGKETRSLSSISEL